MVFGNKKKIKGAFFPKSNKVSDAHLHEIIEKSKAAFLLARPTPKFHVFQFLAVQARLVLKRIGLLQLVIVLAQVGWLYQFFSTNLHHNHPMLLPFSLAMFGLMIVVPGIPLFERSHVYKMEEVELSSFVGNSRLALARLFILGCVSLLSLCITSLTTYVGISHAGMQVGGAIFFLVLTYLLGILGSLTLLSCGKCRFSSLYSVIYCIVLMVTLTAIYLNWPMFFQVSLRISHWVIICTVLVCVVARGISLVARSRTMDKRIFLR